MADSSRPAAMSWIRRHIPTRESIHRYRLLRPFAARLSNPSLWRMTHRSVPRGVALGLGIGVIIPFMHTIIAAILAIPLRANVAVAAAATLVVNPLTMGPIYIAAYKIGRWEMHHDSDLVTAAATQRFTSELSRFLFWVHHASGPIGVGILTLAAAAAVLGYVLSSLAWRWWVGSKWRQRRQTRFGRRV